MGFDPDTSPSQLTPDSLPGATPGQSWIRTYGDPFYIVDGDVPLREIRNANSAQWSSTYGGANDQWATRMQDVIDTLGGLPVPDDAVQQITADKYIHVYQPSTDIFAQMYYAYSDYVEDPGTLTLTITGGTPSSGSFVLTFRYRDNRTFYAYNFTTTAINYNDPASTILTKVRQATTMIGGTPFQLQTLSPDPVDVSGGPLPGTPIIIKFWIGSPNRAVNGSISSNTMNNSATCTPTSHATGPVKLCFGGSVIAPGGGRGGISEFWGSYRDFQAGGFYWEDHRWGGAATAMEYMGGQPSHDEVAYSQANGDISLDHAITMLCQAQSPSSVPGFLSPASRTDGIFNDNTYIPEGARVTFPADIDESYVATNYPEALWLLRTIRDKGVMIYDRTFGGAELTFRQSNFVTDDTTDPNTESGIYWGDLMPTLNGGSGPHEIMQALPWHLAEIYDPNFSNFITPSSAAAGGAYFGVRM
jgi:hypothetical protein